MRNFFKHHKNDHAFENLLTLPNLITYILMFLNRVKAQNPTFSWVGSSEGYYDGKPTTWYTDVCFDLNIAYNNVTGGLTPAMPGEIIFKENYKPPECHGLSTYKPELAYTPCVTGSFPDTYDFSVLLLCDDKYKINFTLHTSLFYDYSASDVYQCLLKSFKTNGCPIEYVSFEEQAERSGQKTLRIVGITVGSGTGTLMLYALICCGPKLLAKIRDIHTRHQAADEHKKLTEKSEALLCAPRIGYGTTSEV